ncbi:hypothetical protein [Dictyobacter aurantiacus]|uniref:Uncharacterized protein n=1 Tax=Dictyobacter aurantiacus TaxID=1936993 RepID=A0A401ZQK2_9CHLR|nr:hypothetical protein [Dictyobacter aurantiacus]GCE09145.1 hypothetical protein KDAU_64740 [Dictyobacter aurantiacus]
MQVTFTFNTDALQRSRHIQIGLGKKAPYNIPPDPIYNPVHSFHNRYATPAPGYPFSLVTLLHATAVKKLGYPGSISRFIKRSLLITGGLYLALNPRHPDLEIRKIMGDFASGFSHDFGVGLTLLAISDMFNINFDNLNPIRVQGTKALDYATLLPNNQGLLQIEAKGVTSNESRNNARRSIYAKKQSSQNTVVLESGKTLTHTQVIKLGIIVQAACQSKTPSVNSKKKGQTQIRRGLIEIIDPTPNENLSNLPNEYFTASKYYHYAGIALFSGLSQIAEEFVLRAQSLIKGIHRDFELQNFRFDERMLWQRQNRTLVGVRWQPSDIPLGANDVWFYQAADQDILQQILRYGEFPETHAYHPEISSIDQGNLAESMLPDGSYFGIGTYQSKGLTFESPF